MVILNKAMVRAIGQGVDRLMDGDPRDRAEAEEVIRTLEALGYAYGGGSFFHRDEILVNRISEKYPEAVRDLKAKTVEAKAKFLREIGFKDEPIRKWDERG